MVCPSLILFLFINGSFFVIVWRRASEVPSLRGPTWKRHGRELQGQYPSRWTHHDSTRSPPDSRKDKQEVEVILRWLLQENAIIPGTIFNLMDCSVARLITFSQTASPPRIVKHTFVFPRAGEWGRGVLLCHQSTGDRID